MLAHTSIVHLSRRLCGSDDYSFALVVYCSKPNRKQLQDLPFNSRPSYFTF
ncbi:hypothetical protein PPIS_b0624 [Pseudoalteromonas piscicida]|uniref:Uncharacterized protein n=1 Tax=Pseudoalteromonas piscicida TaxID=43662 RepID=A0ABN5CND7_PSEO7|nr:hypothetical protein PPIS_b0624 [Pseudoalteromonas piscicida]